MNNYYALIYLTEELKTNCLDRAFEFSISPHKNVWEGYLANDTDTIRLVFSANPGETALFTDRYKAAKKSNTIRFFERIEAHIITDIVLAESDRFITLYFGTEYSLIFQLFGNRPNIFLVKNNLIIDAFKQPDVHTGKPAPEPRKPSSKKKPLKQGLSPKNAIIKTNPKFPRHLIPLLIEEYELEKKSTGEIASLTEKCTTVMTEKPQFRVLSTGNLCLLPFDILSAENKKVFAKINDAVRFAYYNTSRERRLTERLQSIKPRLESAIKKTERTIQQLENADIALERAEMYEQYGHLLMAKAHIKPDNGTEFLEVENFYDANKPVRIPIKPELTVAENAQNYYDKSSGAVRSVEESRRRLTETEKRLNELRTLNTSINNIEQVYQFDDWFKENETELQRLGILSQNVQKETSPYRKLTIDGFEVWVGKNAKSNDRLTTDAHKEDVWMHARGVSGSHVVIRMNNRQEMPQKSVILQAAAIAAWNSKARGAGLVPVIFTKRKYVTKPKGAPAGTVRVQREQVEMVKPQKIA
ncbi:MAG: DUF814 domain-containing protein [Balneolaceae bacterium]|nr:MAG: DUF814 domain-containing protein [Balneolaceae bacterium]